MQITKREATKVVDKLRFRTRATHHKMASFVYEGRLILRTRISFGRGDLPASITYQFRNQLKLSEQQLREVVRCTLDHEGYVALLKQKGYIEGN